MLYNEKISNNYKHLSFSERELIYHLFFKQNKNVSQIAKELNRNRSTIHRELKRNTLYSDYKPLVAHAIYFKRRNHKNLFLWKKYKSFNDLFLEKYNKRWHGIEATHHYIKSNYCNVLCPSVKQIYNWINTNNWILRKSDKLRTKYIKGRKRKIGMYSKFDEKYVFPLWMRPKHIENREEFGHWEIDLVIGKKQKGYHNLLVMVERKTRMTFIDKVKNKHPHSINAAIKRIAEKNKLIVKTVTVDNGLEFANIGILAYWLDCKAYFCEPYASYQRGSNENVNGLIRRLYKKGFDFSLLSSNDIANLQNKINNIPRKIFGFMTGFEYYNKQINSM